MPMRVVPEVDRIHSRSVTDGTRSHSIEASLRPMGEHISGSGFSTWQEAAFALKAGRDLGRRDHIGTMIANRRLPLLCPGNAT